MKYNKDRAILSCLLCAWSLSFYTPTPATAAEYVSCDTVAKDAGTLHRLVQTAPPKEEAALIAKMIQTEYGKVVVDVALAAAKSGDTRGYIRAWHTACLKLTT